MCVLATPLSTFGTSRSNYILGLEVIQLEFILRLKIKRNDWLLVDTFPQAAKFFLPRGQAVLFRGTGREVPNVLYYCKRLSFCTLKIADSFYTTHFLRDHSVIIVPPMDGFN